jgi:hypothetical protein
MRRVLKHNYVLCSLKTHLLQKIIQIFEPVHWLVGKKLKRAAHFSKTGWFTILRTQQYLSCRKVFGDRIVGPGFGPPRSPDPTSLEFFILGFFKERVYSNSTGSLEDFKYNTERTLTNKVLDMLQKKKLKIVNAFLQRGGKSFSICCNYTLFIIFMISLK